MVNTENILKSTKADRTGTVQFSMGLSSNNRDRDRETEYDNGNTFGKFNSA